MKIFGKIYDKNKVLYWGLIITFAILYISTAFVSWYHAITFFNIANAAWLSVILSFVAEVGQAGILFSLLLSKNKGKTLSWITMIILTLLQVIGNVVASYKFIVTSGNNDFSFFQKSILFWVQTDSPEMFKVIIAWIAGALLPIIALSMTGLVAQNIKLMEEELESKKVSIPAEDIDEIIKNEVEKEVKEKIDQLNKVENNSAPVDLTEEEQPQLELNKHDTEPDDYIMSDEFLNKVKEKLQEIEKNKDKTFNLGGDGETIVVDPQVEIAIPSNAIKDIGVEKVNPQFDVDTTEFKPGWSPLPKPIKSFEDFEKDYLDEDIENLMPETTEEYFKPRLEEPALIPENKDQTTIKSLLTDVVRPEPESIQTSTLYAVRTIDPPKKRGRPPKQKEDSVVELKKEKELLPKEDVRVPERKKRYVDPLKQKSKIQRVKDLKEIIKPSIGDQVIELLENMEKKNKKDSISQPIKSDLEEQDSILVPPELKTPYVNSGVEVVDVKAIPKNEKKTKESIN